MVFGKPPRALRRPGVHLDNLAVLPASLLPFKDEWQAVGNSLPQGEVFIILPAGNTPSRKILDNVVALLQARGQNVTTLSTDGFC